MIKAIVCSFDNLFLRVSDDEKQIMARQLGEIRKESIKLVNVSGRTIEQSREILSRYVDEIDLYGLNGAQTEENRYNISSFFKKAPLYKILDECDRKNVYYRIYCEDGIVSKELNNLYNIITEYATRQQGSDIQKIERIVHFYEVLYKGTHLCPDVIRHLEEKNINVVKLEIVDPNPPVINHFSKFLSAMQDVNYFSACDNNLEVMDSHTGKEGVLELLREHYAIKNNEVLSIAQDDGERRLLWQSGYKGCLIKDFQKFWQEEIFPVDCSKDDSIIGILEKVNKEGKG
ncbi:HAD hydrolase family protein [Anaerocolumna xylanovorans]|uniref:Hydroxymethylpyrimidine pyrophosphatase n=1 Tax=Anaerocolumna xylanovorans DSM 12503 TaxID=1121345 RepID=A0A1M7YEF7_9FIRM|nr:HAD hydrolase family protein [Anaerocolumna xylanovorans]SHO50966.1 Hydroxymethylpyrimidine pyrophosphatase [Anaerocolumna xylanovorans DSM 12503]